MDQGATFVHAVVREILLDAIEAGKVLNVDRKERKEWENACPLAPYQIGRYGQLMEWSADIDDPEQPSPHVNHLFGLHPGVPSLPSPLPNGRKLLKVCSGIGATELPDGAWDGS